MNPEGTSAQPGADATPINPVQTQPLARVVPGAAPAITKVDEVGGEVWDPVTILISYNANPAGVVAQLARASGKNRKVTITNQNPIGGSALLVGATSDEVAAAAVGGTGSKVLTIQPQGARTFTHRAPIYGLAQTAAVICDVSLEAIA